MLSNTKYSYLKHLDFLFWDIISLIISFLLAYRIRFGYFTINFSESWSTLLTVMIFVDIILTLVLRPYSGIFRRSYYQEIGRSFQLAFYNLVLVIIFFYVFKMGRIYSRLMLGTTYILYFFLSNIIKYAWKKNVSERKHELIPLFVFCTRDDCSSVIKDITADDFKKFDIQGINLIDDDTLMQIYDIPVIHKSIIDFITSHHITEVVTSVPPEEMDTDLVKQISDNGIIFNYIIDKIAGYHPEEYHIKRIGIYNTLGIGVFSFTPVQSMYLILKRVLDIIIAITGCVFLIPLYGLVKAANLLSGDKEKIIYRQTRVGKNGKLIRIYKFRSMVPNADIILKELLKDEKYRKEWEENQKLTDDPRITKVGDFLRKTSLDELPQLINVLNGDMSLVGPRPLVEGELEAHNGLKLYQMVKPGITGWWGCNGRSNIEYKERLELEYYYVKNISLYLDMLCVLRTVAALIKRKGAK